MHTTISLATIVALLAGGSLALTRVLVASRSIWNRFPAWVQVLLPVAVTVLTALSAQLVGVKTPVDLAVVLVGCFCMLSPGLPSNRSSAPMQAGVAPTLSPSPQDVAVSANVVKIASIAPPERMFPSLAPSAIEQDAVVTPKDWSGPSGGLVLLLAVAFAVHTTGCAWFESKAPAVEACAPTPAALAGQVAAILAAGGDYESKLEAMFVTDGESVIECAVAAFLSAKSPTVGAEDSDAKARAQVFLAKHPVGK